MGKIYVDAVKVILASNKDKETKLQDMAALSTPVDSESAHYIHELVTQHMPWLIKGGVFNQKQVDISYEEIVAAANNPDHKQKFVVSAYMGDA